MKVAKSVITAAVAVAFVGVVGSWAENYLLLDNSPVTVKGKLTSGVKVEDILPANLSVATVAFVTGGGATGTPFRVLGSGISGSNDNKGTVTGTFAVGTAILVEDFNVDVSKGSSKTTKTVSVWFDEAFDLFTNSSTNLDAVVSNAAICVTTSSSDSKSGTKVSGKFEGVWNDGRDAVKGSIKGSK